MLSLGKELIELENPKLRYKTAGEFPANWKKVKIILTISASLIVPLVLGVVGNNIKNLKKQRELAVNLHYLALSY